MEGYNEIQRGGPDAAPFGQVVIVPLHAPQVDAAYIARDGRTSHVITVVKAPASRVAEQGRKE